MVQNTSFYGSRSLFFFFFNVKLGHHNDSSFLKETRKMIRLAHAH